MRAVITGGAGFLGSHLCERMLKQGWEVLCLDNLVTGATANIAHLKSNPKFSLREQNVSNYIEVEGTVDAVLHFASPASPPDYLKLPIQTLKVGSLGTHNALGLALAKKAKFLLASTSECYGDPDVSPQPESYWGHVNPVGPRGVYDEAKRFAEAMTMAYHRYHGVDTRIVRIFNTYGPRMRLNDGRALPNFLYQALNGEPITVYGDGKQTQLLLCHRFDRRHLPPARIRRARSHQHRQSARNHHPGICRTRSRSCRRRRQRRSREFAPRFERKPEGNAQSRASSGQRSRASGAQRKRSSHRLPSSPAGRSQAALPRHLQGPPHPPLGAQSGTRRRPTPHPRLFPVSHLEPVLSAVEGRAQER